MNEKLSILWLCNLPLPQIAESIGMEKSCFGGWLDGLAKALDFEKIDLGVCFFSSEIKKTQIGNSEGLRYFALPSSEMDETRQSLLSEVLTVSQPDVIHVFGTEYAHSNSMVKLCKKLGLLNKVLVTIQGLVSVYAKHYTSGIPTFWKYYITARDFVYGNTGIYSAQRDLYLRGKAEEETLQIAENVSGRTNWDRACVYHINPNAKHFFCNEILRGTFYEHQWNLERCERHRIFLSQGNYPIKGLHFVLRALPLILKHYPDTKVYIGGSDVVNITGNWKVSLLRGSYGRYLKHLIRKYGLQNHIIFLGLLDENSMCNNFLKSHVFVLPSTIENSPNSLGEAMMLGVPSVASDVGGVMDMLTHNEEGFVYQHDAPYMLAYYVMQVFENDDLAQRFSVRARLKAGITHNKQINAETMIKIYRTISGK